MGELRIADLCIDQTGRLRIQHFGFAPQVTERTNQDVEANSLASLVMDDLIHYLAPERFSQKHASAESEGLCIGSHCLLLVHRSLSPRFHEWFIFDCSTSPSRFYAVELANDTQHR